MTDPRPICPIPPDARVGDVVVFRNGKEKRLTSKFKDSWAVEGLNPGWVLLNGSACTGYDSCSDCVEFKYADGRKHNLPHTGKPKRTQAQRDAAWLRAMANRWFSALLLTKAALTRINNIADRMEGKT